MRRPGWLAALLILTASAWLSITASAGADTSPEQRQLVSTYSPELMLREQTDKRNCDTTEEQYEPTTVNTVLGNPLVEARPLCQRQGQPAIKNGAHRRRHRRPGRHLLPRPAGRSARARPRCTYARDFAALKAAGKAPADHLRPHRQRAGPLRASSSSTGSSTTSTSSTTCTRATGRACRSPSTPTRRGAGPEGRAVPDRPLPARRRREGGLGRRQGPEGGDPSGRLSGGRVARHLLRRRRSTSRTVRAARGSAATTPPSRCGESDPRPVLVPTDPAPGSRVPVADLRGALGPAGEGLQQRPTGANTKTQWREPFTWMDGDPTGQPASCRAGRSWGRRPQRRSAARSRRCRASSTSRRKTRSGRS